MIKPLKMPPKYKISWEKRGKTWLFCGYGDNEWTYTSSLASTVVEEAWKHYNRKKSY